MLDTTSQTGAAPNTPQPRKRRGRWLIVLFIVMLLVMGGLFWLWLKVVNASLWGFQPREMALAQYTPRDVVGDLGGMKVTIPRHMAEYVEYDGDPTWGEKRKGPPPVRTHESKLASFGFDVRYPDMAGLSSPAMRESKKKQKARETSWLRVGIGTGEIFPGDGFMDRWVHMTLERGDKTYWRSNYEKLPNPEHGLEVWALKGIDPKTGLPYREHRDAKNLYIVRDSSGHVLTRIRCSSWMQTSTACTQSWSLEAEGVRALIEVMYRPDFRAHWQDIQHKVTQVILGFKAPDALSAAVSGATSASLLPRQR